MLKGKDCQPGSLCPGAYPSGRKADTLHEGGQEKPLSADPPTGRKEITAEGSSEHPEGGGTAETARIWVNRVGFLLEFVKICLSVESREHNFV